MNVNQIINMIVRMVMRRGLSTGMNAFGKRMSKGKGGESRQSGAANTGPSQKRMRQTTRLAKRMGRF